MATALPKAIILNVGINDQQAIDEEKKEERKWSFILIW